MNNVSIIGRLTKDPDVRKTASDKIVTSFTVAVNKRFAKEGEQQADFIPVVAWEKTGEFCGRYFQKGTQIGVTGRINTRNYDDKEGKKVYITEIIAENVYFADSKKSSNNVNHDSEPAAQRSENNDGFYPPEVDDELPF